MYKVILSTLLLVAVVAAQTSYPNIPQVFTSNVQISGDMSPFPTGGVMYYDFGAQSQRVDVSMWGQNMITLDRYDMLFSFQINPDAKQCKVTPITSAMSPMTVLPGSSYSGEDNVNGDDVSVWTFTMGSSAGGAEITLYVDLQTNANLVRVNMTTTGMQSFSTIMDFSDFDPSAIPSSTFAVPSYCSIPTIPPITPVPASSCPSNPPQGCSCPPSLNFCSQLNYPVSGNPDFETVDGMVADMFNQFVQITNPSANCAASTKAFLCATLFPQCSSALIPLLPCASLCPACGCGGPSDSCAVINGTNACTNYGSVNYCN